MTPLPNNSAGGIYRSSHPMDSHNSSFGSDTDSKLLNLFNESDRLRTFANWSKPFTDKRELAAAGFYYVHFANKGDLVKCPYCYLEISQWEVGWSAHDVHMRKSPHCNFIQNKSKNMQGSPSFVIPGFDVCGRRPSIAEIERRARERTLRDLKINTTESPLFPDYVSKEDRLKSYEKWPESFKLRPNELSEAGFYFSGNELKTVCFQCGGCLSWEEFDDPFVEHAHWFPNCFFIKSYKLRKQAEELAMKKAAYSCVPHRTENLKSPSRNLNYSSLDLSLTSDRLKTFDNWPVPFIDKEELALAGFHYTQLNDRVICYYCNVDVGNWEMGDEPFGEHLKHSPNCKHASFCRSILQSKARNVETSQLENGYDTCGPYDLPNRTSPKYPHYSSIESRLNSFKNWPESSKIRPLALCESGFFYAGTGDHTLCYSCGGGLKDWKEHDDPWIEHALWYSECEYLLSVKGSVFIHEAKRRNRETLALTREEVIAAVNTIEEIVNTTVNQSDVNIGNVNENNGCVNVVKNDIRNGSESPNNEESKLICKICFTREWNKLFYPCGHMACSRCANNLSKCAFCRKPILDKVQIYCS